MCEVYADFDRDCFTCVLELVTALTGKRIFDDKYKVCFFYLILEKSIKI